MPREVPQRDLGRNSDQKQLVVILDEILRFGAYFQTRVDDNILAIPPPTAKISLSIFHEPKDQPRPEYGPPPLHPRDCNADL